MNIKDIKIFMIYGLGRFIPDKLYLKMYYYKKFHKTLNLKNPKTFNEKLQWLKLYDHNPLYTTMVDKYAVKEYVSSKIGSKFIIPTLGVWDHFDEIDFNKLPDKFVLKCTHDSGSIVICKDKDTFNKKEAKKMLEKCLKRNYYYSSREWPYKNVKPRTIAEKYMQDSDNEELKDYKIYTFNGVAKIMGIYTDRGPKTTKVDYFDSNFKLLDFAWGYEHACLCPTKPKNFELMLKLAEELAKGTKHLRVDFYEVNGNVYFGEMTFYDGSGFEKFEPEKWDYKLGMMIDLKK